MPRGQRDDAGPADEAEVLAEQERAAGRRHQRRRCRARSDRPAPCRRSDRPRRARCSSRDGVITEAISHGQAASGGTGTNGSSGSDTMPGHRGDQHDREERIEPDLDQRVPRGMERGGKQNGGEDERVHRRLSFHPRARRIVRRLEARAHLHALARDVDLEARREPRVIDARAAGRRVAERHDAADGVAVGRRRDLAGRLAVAQDQFAAMRDRRVGRGRDEAQQPPRGRLCLRGDAARRGR